jgi:hypothetical protein
MPLADVPRLPPLLEPDCPNFLITMVLLRNIRNSAWAAAAPPLHGIRAPIDRERCVPFAKNDTFAPNSADYQPRRPTSYLSRWL